MSSNPMDGYQDIHPWPYHWSRAIDPRVQADLEVLLSPLFPEFEYWTYENHWIETPDPAEPRAPWVVDCYWDDPEYDRGQVPPAKIDQAFDVCLQLWPEEIRFMVGNKRAFRRHQGVVEWAGVQGDFVDHLHIEFDSEMFVDD